MPRKKKVADPVAKAAQELAKSIIVPLYPAMLLKEAAAVELVDLALSTHKAVSVWQKIPENTVAKAEIRLALINMREAVEKYSDEVTKKTVLKRIAQLEDVSIGAKK